MRLWRSFLKCCLVTLVLVVPAGSYAQHDHPNIDIQSREASITGKPPRILPLGSDQYGEEANQLGEALRKALSLPPTEQVSEYIATMLRYPELLRAQVNLSVQLFGGALSARDRELAVLRLAWLCQAPYEWGEHVSHGKRVGGLNSSEIESITTGSSASVWNERDRAILRAVEELHAHAMISDETWATLALTLDDRQLLELPVLVGFYQSIAYLQNSVRFRLRPGNQGLSAR